jgi:hypothetical protein
LKLKVEIKKETYANEAKKSKRNPVRGGDQDPARGGEGQFTNSAVGGGPAG